MWSLHPRGLPWSLGFHDCIPNWIVSSPGQRLCLNKYVRIPRLLKLRWKKIQKSGENGSRTNKIFCTLHKDKITLFSVSKNVLS